MFSLLATFLSAPSFCPALAVMLKMCLVQVSFLSTVIPKISNSSSSGSLMFIKNRSDLVGFLFSSFLRWSRFCTYTAQMLPSTCLPSSFSPGACSGLSLHTCYHYWVWSHRIWWSHCILIQCVFTSISKVVNKYREQH